MASTQSNEKDEEAAAAPTQNNAGGVREAAAMSASTQNNEKDDQNRKEDVAAPVESEEQNVAGGSGATGARTRPKFMHEDLSATLAINLPQEDFDKLPTRVDQIEYILVKEGFKGKSAAVSSNLYPTHGSKPLP